MSLTATDTVTPGLNKKIFPLLLVNFIGALGYSVILPFLVFLIQEFGGSAVIYGVLGAMYPLFQFIGAPLLGSWSDRVGRKKVLLLSQAGTFISWCIFIVAFFVPVVSLKSIDTESYGIIALTLPILILIVARAFDGLTGGNISVANAYLSDITDGKDRDAGFGKISAAMNLGFIIGPVISGLLSSLPNGKFLTVCLAAAISLVGIFIIQFMLPDTNVRAGKKAYRPSLLRRIFNRELKDCEDSGAEREYQGSVFAIPYVPLFMILYFGIFLAFNFFYAAFPLYAAEILEWSPSRLGFFFTVLSAVMICVQWWLLPKLSDRFKDIALFITGNVLLVVCFSLLTLKNDVYIYTSAVFFGLGNGMMWPSFMAMLSRIGNKTQQGAIQGFAGSAGSLASIVGMLSGGFIYGVLEGRIFYLTAAGLLLISFAGLLLPKKQAE